MGLDKDDMEPWPKHRRDYGVKRKHVTKVANAMSEMAETGLTFGGLEDVEDEALKSLHKTVREAADILDRWAEGLAEEIHYRQNDGKRK